MKKEQWEINYSERVKAIQGAMREGHKFYCETYLGKIEIMGMDESWAYTGKDFSARSWAICSTEVYRWAKEIGIDREYHFK